MRRSIRASHRILVATLVAGTVMAVGNPAAATPPSLWYTFAEAGHSVDNCVQRARAALATEVAGRITVDVPHVNLVNADYNIAIFCEPRGGGSRATIIVAHRASVDAARGVAQNIWAGIRSGLFE